ncbi:hemoglobin subunit beta-2-like [Leptodactylus fuscus]|uniref:hemoglobin subunit beta-2-like n=1 Tax=Leptodactylus fuscus TaxID=238119 RepID=UPI003F4F09FD
MVCLTDEEINIMYDFWGKVDLKIIGGEFLTRFLITNPTIKGQFTTLGDLSSNDAIRHNAKVIDHGEKIMGSVGAALKNINNLNAKLSKYDFESLNVDLTNFKRFGEVLIIVLARNHPKQFTPEVHAIFKKAVTAMSDALRKNTTE